MRPPLFDVGSDTVLRRLRRFAVPAVLGAVLGLLAGLGLHQLTPATWTAQVSVELAGLRDQLDLNPTGPRGQLVSIDTDAQLARSDAVVLAVAVEQQRPPDTVRSSILVTARPLSRVMLLSYTARSPEAAQEGAALAARVFLQERERLYVAPKRDFLDDVHRSTESLDPQFDLVTVVSATPGREVLRQRAFVQELGLVGSGRILGEHGLTAVADRGDIEVPVTSGAATGALLAVLLVLLHDRRRSPVAPVRVDAARPGPLRRARARRGRRVVAGVVVTVLVCSGVSALAATQLVSRTFVGQARVYVPPEGGNAFDSRGSANVQRVDLGTEAELVRSDEVLAAVARDPQVDLTTEQLRSRTRSSPSGRGEVVEITFRGGAAEQVATVTALLAEELVAARERRAARWNEEQRAAVEEEIASADADLVAALGPAGSADLVSALNERVTLLQADSRTLVRNNVNGGQVISTSVQRNQADTYLMLGVAALGPVLGLVLGLATRGGTWRPRPASERGPASAARSWSTGRPA